MRVKIGIFQKLGLFLTAMALTFNYQAAYADNFLGPIAQIQAGLPLGDNTVTSLLAEGGARNVRANLTFGWALDSNNRVKLSGEGLSQKIHYAFNSGGLHHWVSQSAIGLAYQHHLQPISIPNTIVNISGLQFSIYSAYGSGARLSPLSYTLGTNLRNIAGATARGASPGVTVILWDGGEAALDVNYDNVDYHINHQASHRFSGFGGTFHFDQLFPRDLALKLSIANRAPFNSYLAEFDWNKTLWSGMVSIGVFGHFQEGKRTLPNTSLFGIHLGYNFEPAKIQDMTKSLLQWAKEPAVYLPQVLAISDQAG